MSINLAAPDFVRNVGDGLRCRWSTSDDKEKIGQLMGQVFRSSADGPFSISMADQPNLVMADEYPFMRPGDFALVEDTSKPGNPLVACTCLWRHEWSYAGIKFGVGRPEFVATDPAYRGRGLVRALFEMIHARSAAEGHLLQAITGIPYFYRQFGYEYVLDLGGSKVLHLPLVPEKTDDDPEPYTLVAASVADIPHLSTLYHQGRTNSLLWHEAPDAYWHYMVNYWLDPANRLRDRTEVSMGLCYLMIIDETGTVCGYVRVGVRRDWRDLYVRELALYPHINWQTVTPSLLRALRDYGATLPGTKPDTPAFTQIGFGLGRSHPLYDILDSLLVAGHDPYAWYIRVPDIAGFIDRISPALEDRLAASVVTRHTGVVRINFYRGGLQLIFHEGKVAGIEPWPIPIYGADPDLSCPSLVFLQLLLGYRSLTELETFFPDVRAKDESRVLINTLFPACASTVYPLT